MATVWVVGSVNEDVVVRVARGPVPGETVLAKGLERGCGGKGANQAIASARAGSKTRLVAAVGSDDSAERQLAALSDAGVETVDVVRSSAPTGTAFVTVDDLGENSIIVVPGANEDLDGEHILRSLGGVAQSDAILAQGESGVEAIVEASRAARASGAAMILNLAPAIDLDLGLLDLDVLIVNESEAAELAPNESDTPARALALAVKAKSVVVTQGGDGVLVASGDQVNAYAAFQAPAVVDTTGAGDAFCGALAARYAQNKNLSEAVRWGLAAGALAVGAPGAQGADTSRAAILDLLLQHPVSP